MAVPQAWDNVKLVEPVEIGPEIFKGEALESSYGVREPRDEIFKDQGMENVVITTADGALEAAPAMGAADCILDLVSSDVERK